MEDHPYPGLNIDSYDRLESIQGRQKCAKCGKSRKYYCYTCSVALPCTADCIPKVKLPLKIDIIKHPSEVDGKSTAVHAGVIAGDDVTIHTFPSIPEYPDKSKVVLVYPGPDALTLEEYAETHCSPRPQKPDNTEINNSATGIAPNTHDCDSVKTTECTEINNWATVPNTQTRSDCDCIKTSECCNKCQACDKQDNPGKRSNFEQTVVESGAQETVAAGPRCSGCIGDSDQVSISHDRESVPRTEVINEPSRSLDDGDGLIAQEPKAKRTSDDESHSCVKKAKLSACGTYCCPFERVVFIDSTWHQVYKIRTDERLSGLQKIELKAQHTKFWRHQRDKPSTYLATIEAVYYFLREYHNYFVHGPYRGEYDNLLFLFCFMYNKIKLMNDGGKDIKAYQKKSNT